MSTRRQFLKISALASAGLLAPWEFDLRHGMTVAQVLAAQSPQTLLPTKNIPQFVDALPNLHVISDTGSQITLTMKEFQCKVLPSTFKPATGTYTGTWVWGYKGENQPDTSFIGPVIVAERGAPTEIKWVNELPHADPEDPQAEDNSNLVSWLKATDQTLHWANPKGDPMMGNQAHYTGPIPAVPHLHGGEVPAAIDGGPDAWFLSETEEGYQAHGHAYYTMSGAAANEAIYRYPNSQEAAPLWFHDHVLGLTRLNVYAGLAGAYVIKDLALQLPTGLHPIGLGADNKGLPENPIIPLVIQDRSFDVNGQLFFDNAGINPEHPYWIPELVADTIVVNGKVWPFKNVEAKRYRFLFINGSNARTYELFLTNQATGAMGPPMWVIGTDGGYLDTPVKIDPNVTKLVMMPGERYDVIIDFAGFAGQTLLMRNTGRTPYPKGASPQGSTVGRIMQFKVGAVPGGGDMSYNPASGQPLRTGNQTIVRLVNPATGSLAAGITANKTRQLTLNEVMGMPKTVINPVTGVMTAYPGGPLEILVNNTKWSGESSRTYDDFTPVESNGVTEYFSELPNEGDTEVWEIINLTADAHPIHLHLVQFQIMNRQNFNVNKYTKAYAAAFPRGFDFTMNMEVVPGVFVPGYGPPLDYNTGNARALGGNPDINPYLQGPANPPLPNEAGWTDTVIAYPGQVTRIVVRYAPTHKAINAADLYYPFDPDSGHGYVWHCHIIDHEDNEMMRPLQVQPKAGATRTYVKGTDY